MVTMWWNKINMLLVCLRVGTVMVWSLEVWEKKMRKVDLQVFYAWKKRNKLWKNNRGNLGLLAWEKEDNAYNIKWVLGVSEAHC